MDDTVEGLVRYCRENNRVCPLARFWKDLWEMLPDRTRDGGDTPALPKMLRLTEHIEWAAQHGALDAVSGFLRELREEDWFHIGG
jgi:hypothetical protein